MTSRTSPLLEDALSMWRTGLNVWPPAQDGSKRPDRQFWTDLQHRRVTEAELRAVYRDPRRTGVGIVCGASSGGVTLFEFDDQASALTEFETCIADNGLSSLWESIKAGYWERSPGGGLRTLVRRVDPGRSRKLAVRAKQPHEMRDARDRWQVLIETRGAGGYAVIAPSYGTVHRTGGPYELLAGGVDSIASLSAGEWENLCAVARTLDEKPKPIYVAAASSGRVASSADKPSERYNAETRWEDLLPRYGWSVDHCCGDTVYWTRPGKDRGVSASTNYRGNDRLWVFSTSTELDPDRSYDRFGFYAAMEHGGDFRVAARAVSHQHSSQRPQWTGVGLGLRVIRLVPPVRGRRPVVDLSRTEARYGS